MLDHVRSMLLTRLPRDQRGQDLAEYGMLIGLIALAVVVAVTLLGTNLTAVFNNIAGQVGPWVPP